MGLGAQGSSAGPQGHGPRQGPWISRARTMAPVGPHDHVANEVRLRGRRTDAHLSPTTVLYPQFVRGIPARQTRQSERGRARTESLCPRFGCLFAVGFTRSVHWSSLLRPACSFVRGRNRRAARPRRSPRVRAPPLPSGSPSGAPCRPVVCARPRGPATRCGVGFPRCTAVVGPPPGPQASPPTPATRNPYKYKYNAAQNARNRKRNTVPMRHDPRTAERFERAENGDMCTTSSDSNYSKCQVIEKITWS
jgi:hypothetical protein